LRGHIGKYIDGSDHLPRGIPNQFRLRKNVSSRSIRAFDDELYALDGPAFLQRDG